MSDIHIRRTRRSKRYMAPILLDHARIKRLWMGMVLALTVVFLSGYVVGFKKAEVKLASSVDTQDLALPETLAETPTLMEPVVPAQAEPGETIDVDIADTGLDITNELTTVVVVEPVKPAAQLAEVAQVEPVLPASLTAFPPARPLAIGGPAVTDPEQSEELLIQDTANEETASYTIQVGMYGQLDNAEHKVEGLIATDLSAYLTDYMNKKNEIRYNVRFGYFADRQSAREALAIFEKEFSGSGYIVRMPPQTNVSVSVGKNSESSQKIESTIHKTSQL